MSIRPTGNIGHSLPVGLFLFLACMRIAPAQEGPVSFSISGQWTSASRIFLYPFSSDPSEKSIALNLGSSFSPALGLQVALSRNTRLRVHGEYIAHEKEFFSDADLPITDGFTMFILELDFLYQLPLGSERWRMTMSAGLGLYDAERRLSVHDAQAMTTGSTPSMGIIAGLGAEYILTRRLSLRFEMRFRDPVVTVETRFDQPTVTWRNVTYDLDTSPTKSQINANGNVYLLAVLYSL